VPGGVEVKRGNEQREARRVTGTPNFGVKRNWVKPLVR
jgi:hypothetical protein